VTVKISGGGQSAKAIVAHLTYLSRQEFEIETDDNEQLQGKGQEKNLVEDWEPDLDAAQSRSRYRGIAGRKPTKLVHNIVMSIPAGTSLVSVLKGGACSPGNNSHRSTGMPWCCTPVSPICMFTWSSKQRVPIPI
jgi:hypothetical protein